MYNIKRRVIDLEIQKILTRPLNKTLSNKKYVCYFQALFTFPYCKHLGEDMLSMLGSSIILEVIAPPYTLELWLSIWKTYKAQMKDTDLHFLKLWGYPFKPNKDKVGFYVVEATERKLKRPLPVREDKTDYLQRIVDLDQCGYFEGEEYIRSRYKYLSREDRTNDFNKLSNYYFTKNRGKEAVILYPRDFNARVNVVYYQHLYKITNPDNLKELEEKPLFYQLANTYARRLIKELSPDYQLSLDEALKLVLSNNIYKSPKAQKPKE